MWIVIETLYIQDPGNNVFIPLKETCLTLNNFNIEHVYLKTFYLEHLLPETLFTWNIYYLEHLLPGTIFTWNIYYLVQLLPGTFITWYNFYLEHFLLEKASWRPLNLLLRLQEPATIRPTVNSSVLKGGGDIIPLPSTPGTQGKTGEG